jgi:dihydrofolate synthase/folylpolyglutamate synthase
MVSQDYKQIHETEIMDYLTQNFGFEVFTPGLERTEAIYHPFVEYFKNSGTKIITVAGTNGKGQTAHTIGSLLTLEKRSYALWTSPHILSIRERFLYSSDGVAEETTYEELIKAMNESERILNVDLCGVKVSFYEFLFLVFLVIARNRGIQDYLLLEVGLGGRLDAVNHFDADCACITSISRDHQSILGSRYDQILAEKIAVSRRNKPLFTNFELEYLNVQTRKYTDDNSVLWVPIKGSTHYFESNQKMAWEVFRYLEPTSVLTFSEGISKLPLYKGRREIMTFEGKSLIFIGAHNIDGVRRMLQSYLESDDLLVPEELLVSFSQRPIGEVEVMLKSLVEFFGEKATFKLTSFDHPKALDPESIRLASLKVNKGMLNFVFDWKSELKKTPAQTILVCGSYYFIGEVQRFIRA